ncbi:MAG: hypothetical protein OXC19_20290 [Bryobacterales bacterium]|nr:hypothetical protein [Bryobacterales bacterium]
MSDRIWVDWAVTALLTGAVVSGGCIPAADDPRSSAPNVILIMTDDQGWAQVGFHGNRYTDAHPRPDGG